MRIDGDDMIVRTQCAPDAVLAACSDVTATQVGRGTWEYRMPWTLHNVRGCSWLRIPCVSRMPLDYTFPHNTADFANPMDHQIQGADFLVRNPRAYLLMDMGTAKTLTSLWAFDYLRSIGEASRLLVICPKSTLYAVWLKEIRRHLPHIPAHVLTDANKERRLRKAQSNVPIHILNHDGPHVLAAALKKNKYDIIIYDESTAIKNTTTRRYKSIRALLPHDRGLWEMTGTPRPGTPEDVYGQIALMRNVNYDGERCRPEDVMGTAFMSEKAWRDLVMFRKGEVWLPRKTANDTVFYYMQPAFARTKRQVLADLPPVSTPEPLDVDLSKGAADALKTLQREGRVQIEGTHAVMEAANAGVLLSKVLQICSGVAYTGDVLAGVDEGGVRPTHEFDNKVRDAQMLELIDGARGKAIVYVPFRAAVTRVARTIAAYGYKTAEVAGPLGPKQMAQTFADFQREGSCSLDVIVAIPQKMSHGITATAASLTVWYTPIIRPEVYQQANNRMDRPGQKNAMLIARLAATDTERRLYKKLQEGALSQEALLDIYKSFISGT